jgi:serine/threonine protein kinase
MNRVNIKSATVADLQGLAKAGGRIRYHHEGREGHLYVRPRRSPNLLNRAANALSGVTRAKREGVMTVVKLICEKNNVDFKAAMRDSGLSTEEILKLETFGGDLKGEHLARILSRFVQVDDTVYQMGKVLGQGSFGKAFEAHSGDQRIALKAMIEPNGESPQAKVKFAKAQEAHRREVAVHMHAAGSRASSHVIGTGELVTGGDGTAYQPMELAVASGADPIKGDRKRQNIAVLFARKKQGPAEPSLVKKLKEGLSPLPDKVLRRNGTDPVVTLTVRDWVKGLIQLEEQGIAHRDIKPENYLLSAKGKWKIADLGTAGADNSRFKATAGKDDYDVTGNSNSYAKAPEWLAAEDKAADGKFEVGHKADVFSLGVGVFRLLSGGRFPFDGAVGDPDKELMSFDYSQNVSAYAASGLSFCDWYSRHTGLKVEPQWVPFLNAALHADPSMRMSADELVGLDLFQDGQLDDPALRQRMLEKFVR